MAISGIADLRRVLLAACAPIIPPREAPAVPPRG